MIKKKIKLNLGCGKATKDKFINLDFYKHPNTKIDIITNLNKKMPFNDFSVDYIYSSHLLEHLTWIKGEKLIHDCFRILKKNGKIRILIPDFRKIFKSYINKDIKFFKVFMDNLNNNDFKYYYDVYRNPKKIKKERKNNLPPEWHLSKNKKNREKLALRVRKYNHLIEVVDWMVHQYGEHQSLYDCENLSDIFHRAGFKSFKKVKYNYDIDAKQYARKIISICFEAKK
jgi:predicted SAM-dependent methyltransferase